MRTVRELIHTEKKVYILLRNEATRECFVHDAEREGVTYGDKVPLSERSVDDIMALQSDGTICFLGAIGRMCFQANPENVLRVDYEKYVSGEDDFIF